MLITRRSFIKRAAMFIAAPAIIRVADLMPIKAFDDLYPDDGMDLNEASLEEILIEIGDPPYKGLTLNAFGPAQIKAHERYAFGWTYDEHKQILLSNRDRDNGRPPFPEHGSL